MLLPTNIHCHQWDLLFSLVKWGGSQNVNLSTKWTWGDLKSWASHAHVPIKMGFVCFGCRLPRFSQVHIFLEVNNEITLIRIYWATISNFAPSCCSHSQPQILQLCFLHLSVCLSWLEGIDCYSCKKSTKKAPAVTWCKNLHHHYTTIPPRATPFKSLAKMPSQSLSDCPTS